MALPSKLKNFNVYGDGNSWLGQVSEITLPKLARTFEDYRGGGMDAAVKIDMGGQPLECEWTAGGLIRDALRSFGATQIDAFQLRFLGAYQSDSNGKVQKVEISMRGRHEEIDMGAAKAGDENSHKFKTAISYYRLSVDNFVEVEIDVMNMVFTVGGLDRLGDVREAIGIEGGASLSFGVSL
jgi:uncharacterized protein